MLVAQSDEDEEHKVENKPADNLTAYFVVVAVVVVVVDGNSFDSSRTPASGPLLAAEVNADEWMAALSMRGWSASVSVLAATLTLPLFAAMLEILVGTH